MFSCNQGKGCYVDYSSDCNDNNQSSCYDQLDDAIDVIESIYDLANDYLSDLEDDSDDCSCQCNNSCSCKSDYNGCGCKHKSNGYDYKSNGNGCDCNSNYYDRDYKYYDCDCKYDYDDDYDDCKEPYRYWGRKGCYVQKQDCNNYLPRKDKKPCKRRRRRCW